MDKKITTYTEFMTEAERLDPEGWDSARMKNPSLALLVKLGSIAYEQRGLTMGDEGDFWNDVKKARKERRTEFGINCPKCRKKEPKRTPTILLPRQKCKVCGYRDPRPRVDT